MNIAVGSDHAGFEYKEMVKAYLEGKGHKVLDFGTHSSESCDYPEFVMPAAEAVVKGEAAFAVVFGGSGNGEQIAANKVKGIRCALCWSEETARLAREHNNANAIAIGERVTDRERVPRILDAYMAAEFEGGRHARRIGLLEGL